MKKIIYIILILIFFLFLLKGCIKRDLGYDEMPDKASVRPLEVVDFNLPAPTVKEVNGVEYLVSSSKAGKFGGDLVSSNIGEGPKTFNPFNSTDATSTVLSGIMYAGLLSSDPHTGQIIPGLAKEYKILPDKKTYIVKLRKGITWSDGVEITADDVVFTFRDILYGGFGDTSLRDSLIVDGKLPVVEKIDKYTIKFQTPVPLATFLRTLASPVAPKHIFKPAVDKGKEYFRSFHSTTTNPKDFVVSGPFKLKEYVPAQRVVFERNEKYHVIDKKGQKLPYLDRWVVLIVGDLNNDAIKFEAGETDVYDILGPMVSRFRELEKNSDYVLYNLGPTTKTTFIVFNMNTRKNSKGKFYVDPIKQGWFSDENFRSAIDWAIDRENLVLNVLSGVGEPLHTAESLSSIFLNKEVAKGHPKDLEKAKELLKKSGFQLKGGVLYDKFNNRVEFELLTNAGNTQREATGVSIKEDLSKLGIKVNFKPIEFNSLINRVSNTVDFDCVLIALTGSPLEPHAGNNVWRSDGTLHIFNQRTEDDLKGSDKLYPFEIELNKIFDEGKVETDVEKRKVLYKKYQEIVAENNPIIYLFSDSTIVAVRKKFKNIYPTRFFFTPVEGVIYNIDEIYIE